MTKITIRTSIDYTIESTFTIDVDVEIDEDVDQTDAYELHDALADIATEHLNTLSDDKLLALQITGTVLTITNTDITVENAEFA